MRFNHFMLLALVLLFSCDPNDNVPPLPEPPSTATNKADTILNRIEFRKSASAAPWVTYKPAYDANKRLSAFTYIIGNGYAAWLFERDSQGRVKKITKTYDTLSPADFEYIDFFYYNGNTKFPSYKLTKEPFYQGDSTAFSHSADGKLTGMLYYTLGLQNLYELNFSAKYSYDSRGNLLQKQSYAYYYPNSQGELQDTYILKYDDKTNPLQLSPLEAEQINMPELASANNLKERIHQQRSGAIAAHETRESLYNEFNRPVSGIYNSRENSNLTFYFTNYYYQK